MRDEVVSESLVSLADRLRRGELALGAYVDVLERLFEAREPEVLAFVPDAGRFERLRREAAALAAHFPRADERPPLYGLPVGVKDIFHVQGFETRAGSRLPPARLQGAEGESVRRLRNAGALIMGKTASTEFAYFAPGPTRNPHDARHTPGGSSSGSAAAVGAGLCPLALGTQTIGSIVRPAAFCGVVGFKPSYGRISTEGVIPLSPSLDHVGVFAAEAGGAALAASVLCHDWGPTPAPRRPVLGVPEGPYLEQASADGLAHFRATCRRLQAAGYTVKPVPAMPDFEAVRERHNALVAGEAARVHAAWFAEYADLYHPKTADLIRRGQGISEDQLALAREGRERLRQELLGLMRVHGLDAWISPAAPGPAPEGLEGTGDPVMNLPWTHAGLPAVSLPAGRSAAGLPLGLQVVGGWNADEHLLARAAAIEHVLGAGR